MSHRKLHSDVLEDLHGTAEGVAQFIEQGVWDDVVERSWTQDLDGLAQLLDPSGHRWRCSLICRYLCVKRCGLVCLRLCGPPDLRQKPTLKTFQEFTRVVARLGKDDEILVPLVRAIDTENEDELKRVLEQHQLGRFCHLLCSWICSIRCGIHCQLVCEPDQIVVLPDLVDEVRAASQAIAKVAADRAAPKALYEAVQEGDVERIQAVIEKLALLEPCHWICHFLCAWECFRVCLTLCRAFPIEVPRDPVEEIAEFGRVTVDLARKGVLEKLAASVAAGDTEHFVGLVRELGLERYCHQICRWICVFRCRLFCKLVCPPVCELVEPQGCVEEIEIQGQNILRGVEIRGTAAGLFCDYYTLEWREASAAAWRSDWITYAGPDPTKGTCGVLNDVLGWLQTYPAVPGGPVEIRLCVYSTRDNELPCCRTLVFELKKNLVWISQVESIPVETPPGVFDDNARLLDASGELRSFGAWVHPIGTAWVGGCVGEKLKRYTLSYHPGFVNNAALPGFVEFWQVDFTINPFQEAYRDTDPVNEERLTRIWKRRRFCFGGPCFTFANYLADSDWNTRTPQLHRVEPVDPPATPNPATWTSTPLPLPNCQSGRYTIRLTVEDTVGGFKHDLQHIWFDNKTMSATHAKISQIAGVAPCDVIDLSHFVIGGGDCTQPWPAQLLGIAYDEYIEEGNTTRPSDNFGGYRLWVKKDGAPNPGEEVPIPGPSGPPYAGPYVGTSRVGTPDPADRCSNPVPPAGVVPPETAGILTVLDMRRFDADCNPAEPGLTLQRGECCDYVISLLVWDTSVCHGLSNHRHERWHTFPVRICNDLG